MSYLHQGSKHEVVNDETTYLWVIETPLHRKLQKN